MNKRPVFSALIAVAVLLAAITPIQSRAIFWPTYRGAWFTISYPLEFIVHPSMKSSTAGVKGYDSAFFASPDHKIEFYIYSPQWSGEPTDVALKPNFEKLISTKTVKAKDKTTTWTAISAKNGSYTRSLLDIKDSSIRKVFGIKYTDPKTLAKYKKYYQKFKESLVQYAD